jgi:hypothetical protein
MAAFGTRAGGGWRRRLAATGCGGGEAVGREEKKTEREREVMTSGSHIHVSSTSAKTHSKTAGWSKLNGFVTSIVKDIRFGVGCSKSNFDKSWMVTNGLYSGRISSW